MGWLKNLFGRNENAAAIETLVKQAVDANKVVTIEEVAGACGVTPDEINKLWERSVVNALKIKTDHVLSHESLQAEEIAELLVLRHGYGIADDQILTQALHDRLDLWEATYMPIEVQPCPFIMKKGESCYVIEDVEAHEIRQKVVSRSYGGNSIRIPIAKGVSFNTGHYAIRSVKRDVDFSFGNGTMAITNQRIIFSLPNKNITIKLDALLSVDYFVDGVRLHKATGKPLIITYPKNKAIAMRFARILAGEMGDRRVLAKVNPSLITSQG